MVASNAHSSLASHESQNPQKMGAQLNPQKQSWWLNHSPTQIISPPHPQLEDWFDKEYSGLAKSQLCFMK